MYAFRERLEDEQISNQLLNRDINSSFTPQANQTINRQYRCLSKYDLTRSHRLLPSRMQHPL